MQSYYEHVDYEIVQTFADFNGNIYYEIKANNYVDKDVLCKQISVEWLASNKYDILKHRSNGNTYTIEIMYTPNNTNKDVNDSSPDKCYNCNSTNIEVDETILGESEVSVKINCLNCCESWFEIYKYSHYEKLKDLKDEN